MDDFGRHKRISQQFDGNVIGLAGPNGKGKSTVIQALQLALTGTIEHPDSLNAFIRKAGGDKPPKKARVKVDFVADGKKGSITRVITNNTNSRELVWEGLPDDTKSLTADKRVADILFEILGVDKKAINSTVFIGQGELGKMFGKDTERREFYTRLLMLGHLDKIADVVDVYRKQIADSTQDLTAVKDATDTSYTQAQEFYELCLQELGAMVSPKEDIAAAMALVGLFSRHASTEQAFTDAETALAAAQGPNDVSNAERESRIEALQQWLDAANLKRRTHATLTSSAAKAQADVKRTADAARAFAALDKAEAALAALPPQLALDPHEELVTLDGYLTNFAEVEKLEDQIPGLEAAVVRCKAALDAVEGIADLQELRDTASNQVITLMNDIALREKIAKELAAFGSGVCCAVCGSGDPDSEYLSKTITELNLQLVEARQSFNEVMARHVVVRDRHTAAEGHLTSADLELGRVTTDLKRRKVMAGMVGTLADIQARRGVAVTACSAYITDAADRKRLNGEVLACKGEARLFERPASGLYEELTQTADAAEDALAAFVMDPTLDQQEVPVVAEMGELRRKIAASSAAQAAYTAAEIQRGTVEQELQFALDHISQANPILHARLDGTGALTASTVTKAAEDMRLEQTAYDHQVGKVAAAREATLLASTAVGELERKIAEQGERRILVQDLCKLRDTFKPSGASLEYLDYKFGQIASMASDYLAESQADFMVAASADIPLAFEFVRLDRPDEVWMAQNRMSGGQKVRLAVATLRAIHALVMPDVGLLVLDEPTTHLDDDAVRSMAEMLKKIGDEGTLQMVVCDHNPVLIDAFSDIIEIPE